MDPAANSAAMQQLLQWSGMQNPYLGAYGGAYYPGYGPGAASMGFGGDSWDNYVPPLAVRVEGLSFHYQLTDDDVRKVFSRYGHVQSVDVKHGGNLAYIQFLSNSHALAAIQDLDGKTLAGLKGGKLRVGFDNGVSGNAAPRWNGVAQSWPWQGGASNSVVSNTNAAGNVANDNDAKKFTCKVEFDIENDKEFRVSSKVIAVARRIWMELPHFQDRGGKTRLRGKGSGFLEGAEQKEADEALHLCISCRDQDSFEEAVSMAVKEIQQIQRDFIAYRKSKGLPVPKNLGCKVERQTRGGPDDAVTPPEPKPSVNEETKTTGGKKNKENKVDEKRGGRKEGGQKTSTSGSNNTPKESKTAAAS